MNDMYSTVQPHEQLASENEEEFENHNRVEEGRYQSSTHEGGRGGQKVLRERNANYPPPLVPGTIPKAIISKKSFMGKTSKSASKRLLVY